MKKKIVSLLLAALMMVSLFPLGVAAADTPAEQILKFNVSSVVEGSVSTVDPRFADGYTHYDPVSGQYNMINLWYDPVNNWDCNLDGYVFTADEKASGSSTEAVVSFFVRPSEDYNLNVSLYHWQNATDWVAAPETLNGGVWNHVVIPLNSFTSKGSEAYQALTLHDDPWSSPNPSIDVTPAIVYSNANIPQYSEATDIVVPEAMTIYPNTTESIPVTYIGDEGTTIIPMPLSIVSDNEAVVKVEANGDLTAVSAGTATVTVTPEGGWEYQIAVTVDDTSAEIVTSFNITPSDVVEGSVSLNDPRFANGYMHYEPIEGQYNMINLWYDPVNHWETNLSDYVFTAEEKAAGSSSDAMLSFYVRPSEDYTLNVSLYYWDSSITTDWVTVPQTLTGGVWNHVVMPMDLFTSKGTEKYQSLILHDDPWNAPNPTIDVTPAYIYSNPNIPQYSDAQGEIILSDTEITMPALTTKKLFIEEENAVVTPGQTVVLPAAEYTIDNELVATVAADGTVKAISEGTATITVNVEGKEEPLTCVVTVTAEAALETIGTYSIAANAATDAEMGTIYTVNNNVAEAVNYEWWNAPTHAFFYNGENDWDMLDLTAYIGAEAISSDAVMSFYIKASTAGSYDLKFFHTADAVYADSSRYRLTVTAANEWQQVIIPLSSFTYSNGGTAIFGRFDFQPMGYYSTGSNSGFSVTPITILNYNPYREVTSAVEGITAENSVYKTGDTVELNAEGTTAFITYLKNGELVTEPVLTYVGDTAYGFRMPASIVNISSATTFEQGDINGDGKVNLVDFVRLKKYVAELEVGVVAYACDFFADGEINADDLAQLRMNILSIKKK